jgi:hypothetical protein
MTAAAHLGRKDSLENKIFALGLSRRRTKHLLFPKIRSGLGPGRQDNLRGPVLKTYSVHDFGRQWKKENILDTELEVFAKIGNHPFHTRLIAGSQ